MRCRSDLIAPQLRDPICVELAAIHGALCVNGHTGRVPQVPVLGVADREQISLRGELLNPASERICHVDVADGVQRDLLGKTEPAQPTSADSEADPAALAQVLPLGREDLNRLLKASATNTLPDGLHHDPRRCVSCVIVDGARQ
jgi:hypothetical protein